MVKFEHHVFQEHYMWSYARFLMYLKQSKDSDLNGPESFVKTKVSRQVGLPMCEHTAPYTLHYEPREAS